MIGKHQVAGIAAAAALLAGCHAKPAAPTINYTMTQIMEPTAQTIWDITAKAYNDKGDALVAAKLSTADWLEVGKAGQKMRDGAQALADADHVVVAGKNEPLLGEQAVGIKGNIGKDWDAVDAKQVQARIDADPKQFAQHARTLADAGAAFMQAAANKDVALFYKVSGDLDETCDGCHKPFWGTDEPPPFPK